MGSDAHASVMLTSIRHIQRIVTPYLILISWWMQSQGINSYLSWMHSSGTTRYGWPLKMKRRPHLSQIKIFFAIRLCPSAWRMRVRPTNGSSTRSSKSRSVRTWYRWMACLLKAKLLSTTSPTSKKCSPHYSAFKSSSISASECLALPLTNFLIKWTYEKNLSGVVI